MISKQNTFSLLVFLTLLSFGFFGSLSHIFTLALVGLTAIDYFQCKKGRKIKLTSKYLFTILTGCFFFLFFNSLFQSDFKSTLISLSPMLPIPIIGLLIIFSCGKSFNISSKQISLFSQISIFFALLVYWLLSIYTSPGSTFYFFHAGRTTLLSGNPIPFSFAILGVSIFCLSDWKNSSTLIRLFALICFLVGSYFAGVLSGTRATLFSLLLMSPIIIVFLCKTVLTTVLHLLALTSILSIIVFLQVLDIVSIRYLEHIKAGLETLFFFSNSESSVSYRLEMWFASFEAISTLPLLGYNVTERFNAISPYLSDEFLTAFSHPHNDILATTISGGFIGGILGSLSLFSTVMAILLADRKNSERIFFGLIMACPIIITASVSTVFFNDICAAWLAFSTYLIWKMEFAKC